jgi:hypothetical protein
VLVVASRDRLSFIVFGTVFSLETSGIILDSMTLLSSR